MTHVDAPSDSFRTLDELAVRVAHRDDVIVAKLDFTANDLPDFNPKLYRNCFLFPKGGGEVRKFFLIYMKLKTL